METNKFNIAGRFKGTDYVDVATDKKLGCGDYGKLFTKDELRKDTKNHQDVKYKHILDSDLTDYVFQNCVFTDCQFECVVGCTFVNCTFRWCRILYMEQCEINGCVFDNVTFSGVYSNRADGCYLKHCRFYWSQLKDNSGLNMYIYGCDFMNAEIFNNTLEIEKLDYQCPGIANVAPDGAFIAYKLSRASVSGTALLIKILIPDYAERVSCTDNSLKVSACEVISITDSTGNNVDQATSFWNPKFVYTVGETVEAGNYDSNRWEKYTGGIHCWLSADSAWSEK